MGEWISVKDRLPTVKDRSRVLIYTVNCGAMVASIEGMTDEDYNFIPGWTWGVINDVEFQPQDVTHWQALPNPPKD